MFGIYSLVFGQIELNYIYEFTNEYTLETLDLIIQFLASGE